MRDWALELCGRVEAELDAGPIGDAAIEWAHTRGLLSGLFLLNALRDSRWTPSAQATSAIPLLLMRQALRRMDELVPGCQWDLLENPAVMPTALQPLLTPRGDK